MEGFLSNLLRCNSRVSRVFYVAGVKYSYSLLSRRACAWAWYVSFSDFLLPLGMFSLLPNAALSPEPSRSRLHP